MDHGLEGFTLVEVMVATMILALGAALIYESFFRSADAHGYAQAYFSVSPWLEEKIWRTQDSIERYGTSAPIATEGKASIGNKEYEWEMTYGLAGENDEQQIYDIELILFLQYGENVRELSRYASAIYEKEQNE
ncbi:MAG: prepilin-type N-terminal cleavage/methylation domain-containing protein [Candidatus Omnitrophica bacterium]|nr:prepilin-type N-terminal cleavage/methylation domain-containing protein [Candidatus Omnitrophota bacterium]